MSSAVAAKPQKARRPRREVTDQMVRAALADPDVTNVMRAEGAKYRRALDEDQVESASYEGLLKALSYHREGFGQKFTTSLWKFLNWELRRALKRHRRQVGGPGMRRADGDIADMADFLSAGGTRADPDGGLAEDPADRERRDQMEHVVDAARRYLSRDVRRVIHQHFFDNLTVEEIGRANGYSKEAARQRLDFGLRRLRQVCADDPDGV